jgi:hypothetical protein
MSAPYLPASWELHRKTYMDVPCLPWSRAFDSNQVHAVCLASTGYEVSTVAALMGVPNPLESLGTSKLVLFNVDNYVLQS